MSRGVAQNSSFSEAVLVKVLVVDPEDTNDIIWREESHFFDVKAREIRPASLSKTISAFANTSGGEIYVGVSESERDGNKQRAWQGFDDQEAANPIFATIEELGVTDIVSSSFLASENEDGYILHLIIQKSRRIINATNGDPYKRSNAQSIAVREPEALRRLELDKGIASFEDDTVNAPLDSIANSVTSIEFLLEQVPSAEPEGWLRSQFLIHKDLPTVASILLFADEPQAILPKRSAIKIFRYKTVEESLEREALMFDPLTVEGPACDLIREAVAQTKEVIEGIKRLTEGGLEEISYPDETLHEIITNAVLHRDYSIATDIQIRVYDDRVEVQSPGQLAGHVTIENVLDEQFARNPKLVRMTNKFPDPPNKDVGEGLNTAFDAMRKIRLREPEIIEKENSVVVHIRHQRLSSPAQIVMEYLDDNGEITNQIGREITGLKRDVQMKDVFVALRKRELIEQVPGKRGRASAWRKTGRGVPLDRDLEPELPGPSD